MPRVIRSIPALLLWVVWVVASRSAFAAGPEGPDVAVLPLQVEGEIEEHAIEQLEVSVNQGIGREGRLSVMGTASVRSELGVSACADAACAAGVAEKGKAQTTLRATVRLDGRDYNIRVEALREDGTVLAENEQPCDICGIAEVAQQLGNQAAQMVDPIETYIRERAILIVNSTPSGAKVKVDGKVVGTTPFEGEVRPGKRLVEVSLPGYTLKEETVSAVAGNDTPVDFELEAYSEDKVRPHAALGWTPLVVGAGAVASGGALIAIEEGEVKNLCSKPENIDMFGTCKWRYSTIEGGAVMIGVGAAAMAAGIAILIVRAKKKKRGKFAVSTNAGGLNLRF